MATNITPKISIIVTTKDRGSFIPKAVESALKQSFTDWELIILDDDSKDATETILAPYRAQDSRIKYYKNSPALGICGNRNKGLALATGKYIAVLDSDDFWLDQDKLQKQYNFLEQNSDYVLVGSNIKIINEEGVFIKETNFATEDGEIRNKILKDNQIPHSSVLIRKDAINNIGGYNKSLSCVEDLDLFLKLGLKGKLKNLSEATTTYTRHTEGFSQKRKREMAINHAKIVWKNRGCYPGWLKAVIWADLRILKSILS